MARRENRAAGVVGYVRVSTFEQADRGVSLAAQRQRLSAYCEAHGLALLRVEEDAGVSARRTSNRPALQRALKALAKVTVERLDGADEKELFPSDFSERDVKRLAALDKMVEPDGK